MSDWKTEEKEIEERTGLGIGVVEIRGKTFKNNICLYDCDSANFHLLPDLNLEDAKEAVEDYIKTLNSVQDEIYKRIQSKYNLQNGKGKGTGTLSEKVYPLEYREREIPNGFYKYISVYDGQRFYTINFMRWYIDKENKVNCRFGEIQFDTTMNEKKRVNTARLSEKDKKQKDIIRYPESYKHQSEKVIRLDGECQACIYDPKDVGDIWQIKKESCYDEVVEKFAEFIEEVKKQAAE